RDRGSSANRQILERLADTVAAGPRFRNRRRPANGASPEGPFRSYHPAAMPGVERGCLLIADISGYTAYLSGVELEHAHDILADLLGTVIGELRGLFQLAKLEGDAVFCHAPEPEPSDDAGVGAGGHDGSTLLTAV